MTAGLPALENSPTDVLWPAVFGKVAFPFFLSEQAPSISPQASAPLLPAQGQVLLDAASLAPEGL